MRVDAAKFCLVECVFSMSITLFLITFYRHRDNFLNFHINVSGFKVKTMYNIPDGMTQKDYKKCRTAIRSALRLHFRRSQYIKDFVSMHRIEWMKGKRKRVSYKCQICSKTYPEKDIEVDHIVPIGSGAFEHIEDCGKFFKKLFCSYDNLQLLCKDCHKEKTRYDKMKF